MASDDGQGTDRPLARHCRLCGLWLPAASPGPFCSTTCREAALAGEADDRDDAAGRPEAEDDGRDDD